MATHQDIELPEGVRRFAGDVRDSVWLHVCPVVLGSGKPLLPRRLRLRRRAIERDGQLTAMLLDVVGPEPQG